MLSRKVIASHVTNLTDARYFAARGVDYLLFDLDDTSIEQILEIKEWVEGPEILILFSYDSIHLKDEALIKIDPKGISGKDAITGTELVHLAAHVTIFDWAETKITLDQIEFFMISDPSELSKLSPECGIVLKGSTEEKIGLKSYDQLDEILDLAE